MARIRSVHPGLFTDENYAVLSFPARELLKGLWIESDDNGIFEWKPLSIKMRIFPADTVSVPELLEELSANWVRQFTVDGRLYGACKNFCKYQRPKKPKTVHPLPDAQKPYVMHGYKPRAGEHAIDDADESGTGTVPVPNSFPTGTEKTGQMEDGGGKKEEEKKNTLPAEAGCASAKSPNPDFEEFWKAYKPPPNAKKPDALKAWNSNAKTRPPQAELLRAVAAYNTWLAEESRKQKRDYPKQHAATWLRGEVWNGYLAPDAALSLDQMRAQRAGLSRMGYPTHKLDRAIEEAEGRAG